MKTKPTASRTMNTWLLSVVILILWGTLSGMLDFGLQTRGRWPSLVGESFGGQAVPLPGETGQPRPPALMQPIPPVRIERPVTPAPAPPSLREGASPPLSKEPSVSGQEERDEGALKIPQVTSFPELTEGVGDSRVLLEE